MQAPNKMSGCSAILKESKQINGAAIKVRSCKKHTALVMLLTFSSQMFDFNFRSDKGLFISPFRENYLNKFII